MASAADGSTDVHTIHHNVNEETLLIDKKTSSTFNLDEDSIKVLLANQKRVYSSITLADVFQKVVFTTIMTSFLVLGSSYLQYSHLRLLQAYFIFNIALWVTTAFVNLFAESIMSKRCAILVGFILYFIGVGGVSGLSMHIFQLELSKYFIIIPLYYICIGEGLCKSFIGDFGYYQFSDARLSDRLKSYTDVLYWLGNTGAVFLIVFLLGICEIGSYTIGIGLCCVCIAAGILSFSLGWTSFKRPSSSEVNSNPLKVLTAIMSNARSVNNLGGANGSSANEQHWLDFAKLENGGNHSEDDVEEAKSFLKVTGIFLSLVPYWVCNSQGYSTFIYQGFHLDVAVGNVNIPISWTALCNIAAVLVFLKISEKYIYPALRRNGYSFPTSWRVISGMLIAFLSMCCAGLVQLYAHSTVFSDGTALHTIGKVNVTYTDQIHILWTVPQYIFLGISEVLVGLTTLTLACRLCKRQFKKLVTSVYYFTIALGHVISIAVLSAGWFPSKEFLIGYEMIVYFFSLGVLCIIGMLIYICVVAESSPKYNTVVVSA